MTEIEIRRYRPADAAAIVRLYYDTIHAVNAADYGPAQLDAWAPEIPDTAAWHDRMSRRCTLVAEEAGVLAGFVELAADAHLDMLFCAEHAVGRGASAPRCTPRPSARRGIGGSAASSPKPASPRAAFSSARDSGSCRRSPCTAGGSSSATSLWRRIWQSINVAPAPFVLSGELSWH